MACTWLPTLDRTSGVPPHRQIVQQTRQAIWDGRLPASMVLHSEPEVARALGIARATLRLAWRRLDQEGLIARQRGRGTVICALPAAARIPTARERALGDEIVALRAEIDQLQAAVAELRDCLASVPPVHRRS